ncbi:hypothetical protein V8C37DRAFT_420083 [Trichoderma ceciliae]
MNLVFSIQPNEKGARAYIIPTVQFPDGTYLMDYRKIAEAIEQKHPSPSVHLDSPTVQKIEGLVLHSIKPIYPILMYKISQVILNEKNYADFVWAGALEFLKRVEEGAFQELLDRTGARDAHERLFEACAP